MRRPFVKVCGITRGEDAVAAAALGADAVGFVFVPTSPRRIDPDEALAIGAMLPDSVARVGVVMDRDAADVRALVAAAGLTAVQAHGGEPAALCRAYGVPVVKAWPAGPDLVPTALAPYREFPVLLDACSERGAGGTGERADWNAARSVREAGFRVMLAGGLARDNVLDAIRTVGPIAVDFNSGVEHAPGLKDLELLDRTLQVFRDWDPPEESTWPW